jgi:serine/threonine protein kinase
MTRCSHCGREHAPGLARCPVTHDPMSVPGPVGKSVDRYQLELLLGTGGFGSVFRARHQHTEQLVALKTLRRQLSQDPQMVERFLREAKAAASVGSENIIRILDAGISPEGTAFLAMELLDGVDLKELATQSGPIAPRRLVDLVGQVLDALDAAHQKGIVHRDLKPANVFVVQKDGRDVAKLLDFGISKMSQAAEKVGLTMTGMGMGTPGYMAPEQFFDARNVDGRADLYSVGAMAYELFAGRLPIEAKSYPEMIIKVREEVPPPLHTLVPSLPPALCAAVDKALARKAEDRFAHARDFAAALRASAGGIGTAAPVPAAPPSRATPMPAQAGAESMLYGQTNKPSFGTPPPEPKPPSFGTPAPAQGGDRQSSGASPLPLAGPLMPQPQAQPVNKSNPLMWVLIIIGTFIVLGGGCCAFSAVANALNQANGTGYSEE